MSFINKKRVLLFFCLFSILLSGALTTTSAATTTPQTTPIKRTVLAFYNPKDRDLDDVTQTLIHQTLEMPFNHLGLKVEYHSVLDPLPTFSSNDGVRGIVTWFTDTNSVKDPEQFCTMLNTALDQNKKLLIVEEFGFLNAETFDMIPACKSVLTKLGVEYLQNWSDNPYFFEVVQKTSKIVEYERPLNLAEGLTYSLIRPISKDVKPHLVIKRTDLENSESFMVFTSPKGGYIHTRYAFYANELIDRRHMRINPFLFIKEVFKTENIPAIDTTTINGYRIFYSHIDGDGIFNISEIDRKSFSGEIIYEKVLKRFPTIPITVSFITGLFDLPEYVGKRMETMYLNMLKLPNTQVGSHGHSHPFDWAKKQLAFNLPGFKFTSDNEIYGSINRIRQFLGRHNILKAVNLFQWTGNCTPTPSDLAVTASHQILNINGGDTRFDEDYDSISFIPPIGIQKGPYIQIYSSNSNENTYTNNWQKPSFQFRNSIDTYKNTESPLRLKPINIYYHYYSGEFKASLQAIIDTYNYIDPLDLTAITTLEYAKLAQEFYQAKIYEISNGYKIESSGNLKTIRLPYNPKRNVSMKSSEGVIGFNIYQDSLYIYLDKRKSHKIALSTSKEKLPYLKFATFQIDSIKFENNTVIIDKRAWHKNKFTLENMTPRSDYKVIVDTRTLPTTFKSDINGTLNIELLNANNLGILERVTIKPAVKT